MAKIAEGARQLPSAHLSIRVPWHDTAWDGRVCANPSQNIACLRLNRIRAERNDPREQRLHGKQWSEIDLQLEGPACVAERANFMSSDELVRKVQHPYHESSKAHKHIAETLLRQPSYSAACIPFRWMLKEGAEERATMLGLGFRLELEKEADKEIGFKTEWIQTKSNQLVMLDTFFSVVEPEQSLCFFYAKETPLSDDPRRTIIGVGKITNVGDPIEYKYSAKGKIQSMLWERMISHSIRSGFKNGFLFPYHEILRRAQVSAEVNPSEFVAYAPDYAWGQYSYSSEHISHDIAIASLLECARVAEKMQEQLKLDLSGQLLWMDRELNRLWKIRGAFPGLGSALTAFGVEHGSLVAYEVAHQLEAGTVGKRKDPWDVVEQAMQKPAILGEVGKHYLEPATREIWKKLKPPRKALLKLLSRFEISADQATRFFQESEREKARIQVTDAEVYKNPYLLFELDREQPTVVPFEVVDRGMFPDPEIAAEFPLPQEAATKGQLDSRRVRALLVDELEDAASDGHTIQPESPLVQRVRDRRLVPSCPLSSDALSAQRSNLHPFVSEVQMADGTPAYQLSRLADCGAKIKNTVLKRISAKRHEGKHDWKAFLTAVLPKLSQIDKTEQRARDEKAAALEELFGSRVSVLIGQAGTGKTTLLKVLCSVPEIANGGVLMLAPTGKARVRMEAQTGRTGAKTIAQFLIDIDRYDPYTGIYRLSSFKPVDVAQTVIIDEASMLTEEQLAAVIDAIKPPQRLILVGDPRQLPPIGSGRPFLDIVRHLAPQNIENQFPRVGPGYAQLTVRRRQMGEERDDLALADWFSGRGLDAGADEIWERVVSGRPSKTLQLVPWRGAADLQEKLLKILVAELGLKSVDDEPGFELTLGGTKSGDSVFFNAKSDKYKSEGAGSRAEAWQILSPVRGESHGVDALNRMIQTQFRKKAFEFATARFRKTPRPMGQEQIIYGDKVINTVNRRRKDVYPETGSLQYVANGEIGMVVGQFKYASSGYKGLPWKLEVEFSSQLGYKYGYDGRDFSEEGQTRLSLAYALTVHKCQGSEFGITFLILPNPCRLLSRELFYTALTRQQRKLIVLHQGELSEIRRFSSEKFSESARRLTNLFSSPKPRKIDNIYLEEGLIHVTARGDLVRSKSEVIIADKLHAKSVQYEYEQEFVGADGTRKLPDFTIDDAESGRKIIWEHAGMLFDPGYRARWERKLNWYRTQGVLPEDKGGGANGMLIVTQDDERGGINSKAIDEIVSRLFS